MQQSEFYLPYYYGDTINGEMQLEEFIELSQKRLALLKKMDTLYFYLSLIT